MKHKLALFCDVDVSCIIENPTVESIYEIPLVMASEHMDEAVLKSLDMALRTLDLESWKDMVYCMQHLHKTVKIAIVGKYVELPDAYISIVEALHHAGVEHYTKVEIEFIASEGLEIKKHLLSSVFQGVDGILVPGGFGERGVEGKIVAAQYAREHKIPYLGLCLGMQVAVIEFARNVCFLDRANSAEFEETPYPVIALMDSQSQIIYKGGTMRLGAYPCHILHGTITQECYQTSFTHERHRHRYEFNNKYRELLQSKGMIIAGTLPDNSLVEIIELPKTMHPFFVACQFHPEFKSRPNRPHPLFSGFIRAALNP